MGVRAGVKRKLSSHDDPDGEGDQARRVAPRSALVRTWYVKDLLSVAFGGML